jgi:8-oxo-dGTP diphosphatase
VKTKPQTPVALALVVRDGLWLVGRRRSSDAFDGLWEFPGGKIREGESASQAAVRECAEELSLAVEPIEALPVVEHDYGDRVVCLHPVLCHPHHGKPIPNDEAVSEARWVDEPTLRSLEMPAANRKIIPLLPGLTAR